MSKMKNLLDKFFLTVEKEEQVKNSLQRFDNAYDDVIKLLPENTVGNFIKQNPDKERRRA